MATTLGTICVLAHSTPNTSVNFFKLTVAASRMLYTVSPNQDMHRLESCSSKKSLPSCVASSGMYSMIACRTRHDLSSASSTMAGKRLSASSWIPMTEENQIRALGFRELNTEGNKPSLTCSSLLMMFSRTSGNSSFSRCKKS